MIGEFSVASYDDTLPLRDARAFYFSANAFDEKSYTDRWVKLRAGPIPLYVPNTASRVRAVRIHDLHHVLTGYDTTWTGEGEIAAFEIASGCADHYAAWYLNLSALAIGILLSPGAMLRAFGRGCRAQNLYRATVDDSLLATTVGTMRRCLALDVDPGPITATDLARFVTWSGAALSMVLLHAALVLAPLWLLVKLAG
jgi:hypothetical protein